MVTGTNCRRISDYEKSNLNARNSFNSPSAQIIITFRFVYCNGPATVYYDRLFSKQCRIVDITVNRCFLQGHYFPDIRILSRHVSYISNWILIEFSRTGNNTNLFIYLIQNVNNSGEFFIVVVNFLTANSKNQNGGQSK